MALVQPGVVKFLAEQSWPGNLRTLDVVMKQMLLGAHGYGIAQDMRRTTRAERAAGAAAGENVDRSLESQRAVSAGNLPLRSCTNPLRRVTGAGLTPRKSPNHLYD